MRRILGWICIATAAFALGACDRDRASLPAPTPPAPASTPSPAGYPLYGLVMDENGSAVANHEVALEEFFTGNKRATTSTNADGAYQMGLGTTTTSFIHAGGGEYDHYYVQAQVNVVQNLRLRRVRTVEAGQSIAISIDRDSSLAVDGGDWWMLDHVWETLHVRVADAGVLTVDARPPVGGSVPSRMVIVNCDVSNNCFT